MCARKARIGGTMEQQTGGTNHGAFTPDVMRQLRARSGMQLHNTLSKELVANVAACVHPRLPVALTAYYGAESRIDLWNLETSQHVQSLHIRGEHSEAMTGVVLLGPDGPIMGTPLPVRDLALAHNGNFAAAACGTGIRLIGVNPAGTQLTEVANLQAGEAGVHSVAFNRKCDILAAADDDGQIALWSTVTRQPVQLFLQADARFRCVCFSSDDLIVAAGDTAGNITVWDAATGQQLAYFQAHQAEVSAVRFSNDTYLLATAGSDGFIQLWDMSQACPVGQPMLHGDSVYDIIFHGNNRLLYSCSFDHRVGVWSIDDQQLVDAYEDDDAILAVAPYPNDEALVLVTSSALKLVLNTPPEALLPLHASPPTPRAVPVDSPQTAAPQDDAFQKASPEDDYWIAPFDDDSIDPLSDPGDSSDGSYDGSFDGELTYGPIDTSETSASFKRDEPFAAPPFEAPPFENAPSSFDRPNPSGVFAPPPPTGGRELRKAPDDIAVQKTRSALAQKSKQENQAMSRARQYQASVLLSIVMACVAALVVYKSTPVAEDNAEYRKKAAPIADTFDQKIEEDKASHSELLEQIDTKIEQLRTGAGSRDVRPMVSKLEEAQETERTRHANKVSELNSQREVQLSSLRREYQPDPMQRTLIAGIATFFGAVILFWFLINFIVSRNPAKS